VALSTKQLMNMARHGATAMIAELKAQIAEIEQTFPSVRATRRTTTRAATRVTRPVAGGRKRGGRKGRRKMSAAQKRVVSARMKKYWAARRTANTKTTKASK
jgi:hypothetical protein